MVFDPGCMMMSRIETVLKPGINHNVSFGERPAMTAVGTKQTSRGEFAMSALRGKADLS
jgi:hypothetical protein